MAPQGAGGRSGPAVFRDRWRGDPVVGHFLAEKRSPAGGNRRHPGGRGVARWGQPDDPRAGD